MVPNHQPDVNVINLWNPMMSHEMTCLAKVQGWHRKDLGHPWATNPGVHWYISLWAISWCMYMYVPYLDCWGILTNPASENSGLLFEKWLMFTIGCESKDIWNSPGFEFSHTSCLEWFCGETSGFNLLRVENLHFEVWMSQVSILKFFRVPHFARFEIKT